jgi:opacity protein-like surface antigen
MKKTFLLLALIAMGASASAQSKDAATKLYGEVGYQRLNLDVGPTTWGSDMLTGTIGYQFHPNVSAEFMLATGLSGETKSAGANSMEVKVNNAYGVFIRPSVRFNDKVSGFVRLGYMHASIDATISSGGKSLSGSDSGDVWAFAPGVTVDFTPRIYGQASWLFTTSNNNVKASGPALALGMKF